jgi:putative phage-type endonuclease
VKQNTPEWIRYRRTKIGSSDAPVIAGVSPWSTPFQLWEEKLGITPPKSSTVAMERGRELESLARLEFMRLTGLEMQPMVMEHKEVPFVIASLDGIDFDQKHIVEIKCPGKDDHSLAMDGIVPGKYIPQLQHQLFVTGLAMVFYFSFDGREGKILEVKRDDEYISRLFSQEKEFYKCIQEFEPPKLTERDYVRMESPEWDSYAKRWKRLQEQKKFLEKEEEELREALLIACGKNNAKGSGIQIYKMVRKGQIQYSMIPALKDIDLDQYRKGHTEVWTIRNIKQ